MLNREFNSLFLKKLAFSNEYLVFAAFVYEGSLRERPASREYGIVIFVTKLVVLSVSLCFCPALHEIIGNFTKRLNNSCMLNIKINFPFVSQQQAASTTIYVATANELTGVSGQYFNNCFFCEPGKLAQNNEMVDSLWDISEEILDRILREKNL